jgi:hypothetical protein
LLLEEVKGGNLKGGDLEHESVDAFVFAAVKAVGQKGAHGA